MASSPRELATQATTAAVGTPVASPIRNVSKSRPSRSPFRNAPRKACTYPNSISGPRGARPAPPALTYWYMMRSGAFFRACTCSGVITGVSWSKNSFSAGRSEGACSEYQS